MKEKLFVWAQYCAPQHLLSRLVGRLAASENPFIKTQFIHRFYKKFDINLSEASIQNKDDYPSFNAFFCRALNADARPIDSDVNAVVSPADGAFSQLGDIENGRIFQAKGQSYTADEILADEKLARIFDQGKFATIYLSPKDYHRVHMPVDGQLVSTTYIPGDLFSVNATTAKQVPRLFSRNERHVSIFDTEFGTVAIILVGAMIVAGIETVWAGHVAPAKKRDIVREGFDGTISLARGEEMGRFKLGSTVILLFQKGEINWQEQCKANSPIKMGERIAAKIQP